MREIVCDESGSEGEKLVGGTTDVFAHASLEMDVADAAACIAQVRIMARSPATECKASVVLRERNRRVLEWLLGPGGPLLGRAHVHVTEKVYHLVTKLVGVLGRDVDEPSAVQVLYRDGPRAFGPATWLQLLGSFNDLVRARGLEEARTPYADFFGLVDALSVSRPAGAAGRVLRALSATRPRADEALVRRLDTTTGVAMLDPLVPALERAVAHWTEGGRVVHVLHDVQGALTRRRVGHLERALEGRLSGITFVDSRDDARIQVADFLAGAARKVASEELNGRGVPHLSAMLRPYVDECSIWGDDVSWSRFGPLHPATGLTGRGIAR